LHGLSGQENFGKFLIMGLNAHNAGPSVRKKRCPRPDAGISKNCDGQRRPGKKLLVAHHRGPDHDLAASD
jgi:hypothetical protein